MHRAPARGGMVALALKESQHNSCSDIPSLFADSMGWFLKHLGFVQGEVTPLRQLLRGVNGVLVAMEGLGGVVLRGGEAQGLIGGSGLINAADWQSAGMEGPRMKEASDMGDKGNGVVTRGHAAWVRACFAEYCSMLDIAESSREG